MSVGTFFVCVLCALALCVGVVTAFVSWAIFGCTCALIAETLRACGVHVSSHCADSWGAGALTCFELCACLLPLLAILYAYCVVSLAKEPYKDIILVHKSARKTVFFCEISLFVRLYVLR